MCKRLLIQGEGRLGETKVDQRANSPTFRITRSCVVRNLDLDMTGFHEAVVVTGGAGVAPIIDGCIIRWACLPLRDAHLSARICNCAYKVICLSEAHMQAHNGQCLGPRH